MPSPDDRLYTQTHEWAKADETTVTLGITRFAVDQLTDVTFVEMRKVGTKVKAGDVIGEVESVKTTSDIYAPVTGEIVEVNPALANEPGLLNSDPYGQGWLVRIKADDLAPLASLHKAQQYDAQHA